MRHAHLNLRSLPILSHYGTLALAASALLGIGVPIRANDAPATQPAPAVAPAAPAQPDAFAPAPGAPQEPAAAPARTDPRNLRVLVLPFGIVGGKESDTWMSKSVQQSVLTDLMTGAPFQIVSGSIPATDAVGAADLGRKSGAELVVFGDIHLNEQAVRITGEILSSSTGRPVAVLKATGSANSLFPVEDALGDQARRALGGGDGLTAAPPDMFRPTPSSSGPATIAQSSPYDYTIPPQSSIPPYLSTYDTGVPYAGPAYGYGYGYGYAPIFIGGGFGREHGHGGYGGGFSRGGFGGRTGGRSGGGHAGGGHR